MALQRSQKVARPLVAQANEQPYPGAGAAAPLVTRDADGRVVDSASASAMAKFPRRGAFLPRKITCDPKFEVHNRRRVGWLRRRRAELHEMTGGVSHAVGAMLACAAWLYAGGEFACERAAETGDLEFFKIAANLTATARTHDMGAWEMAVREGKARPPLTPAEAQARLLARLGMGDETTTAPPPEDEEQPSSAPLPLVVAAADEGAAT